MLGGACVIKALPTEAHLAEAGSCQGAGWLCVGNTEMAAMLSACRKI